MSDLPLFKLPLSRVRVIPRVTKITYNGQTVCETSGMKKFEPQNFGANIFFVDEKVAISRQLNELLLPNQKEFENENRRRQGSNLRGMNPMDFKSIALTTRPLCQSRHKDGFSKYIITPVLEIRER